MTATHPLFDLSALKANRPQPESAAAQSGLRRIVVRNRSSFTAHAAKRMTLGNGVSLRFEREPEAFCTAGHRFVYNDSREGEFMQATGKYFLKCSNFTDDARQCAACRHLSRAELDRVNYTIAITGRFEAWMMPAIICLAEREHGTGPALSKDDLIVSHLYAVTDSGCTVDTSQRAGAIRADERRKHESAKRKRDRQLAAEYQAWLEAQPEYQEEQRQKREREARHEEMKEDWARLFEEMERERATSNDTV